MRYISIIISLLLLPFLATADPTSDSTWLVTHYTKHDVYIPMRDGLRLYTAIYEPKFGKAHPILLNRTPYSVGAYGDGNFNKYWSNHYMAYLKKGYILVLQDVRGAFMSEGNFLDIRPYNPDKKGNETDEASDSWDTIDWLVKHVKNNNHRVGAWGISYPGFYATMIALSGHPALKAVSPQAPVTDQFMGDDVHHNGAFMQMDVFTFYSNFGKPRHELKKQHNTGFQFNTKDSYRFYLDNPPGRLAELMGDSIQFFKDIYSHPNYDNWWKVRNTRHWVQYIQPHVATLVVGGLFDAEDGYGAWALYKAIEKKAENNNRLVIGPWSHGGWARGKGDYLGNIRFGQNTSEWYQKHVEIPFFDHYLLQNDENYHIPEASVFFTGANKWRAFSQWPPAEAKPATWFLHADGSLSTKVPDRDTTVSEDKLERMVTNRMNYFIDSLGIEKMEEISGKTRQQIRNNLRVQIRNLLSRSENSNQYTSDPAKPVPYTENVQFRRTNEYMTDDQRFASRRPDVLVYQTDILKQDIIIAGPITASLAVTVSGTDADFVVKLVDVFPDNFAYSDSVDGKGNGKDYPMGSYQMLVRGDIMRCRYRHGFDTAFKMYPNDLQNIKFDLPDVAHVFKKGHRMMVQIQSSWFPLIDRNPQQFIDIYHCKAKDFLSCEVTVFADPENLSFIKMKVLKN